MQDPLAVQVAHAFSYVQGYFQHGLNARKLCVQAARGADPPAQDCVLQEQDRSQQAGPATGACLCVLQGTEDTGRQGAQRRSRTAYCRRQGARSGVVRWAQPKERQPAQCLRTRSGSCAPKK